MARFDPHTPPSPVDHAANSPADGAPPPLLPETERIAAALEPELRRVIDMTMERVAEIEQETMREARELMASSGQNSQEALERSARLVNSVDNLTGSVGHVTSALRTEVDDVKEALRALHGLKVQLPEELAGGRFDSKAQHTEAHDAEPRPSPDPESPPDRATDSRPADAPAPGAPEPDPPLPDPQIEPSPELTKMFREQITRMRDDGRPRDEAERVLLRYRLGHRFLGMLDDIYLLDAPGGRGRAKRGLFRRFRHGG